MTYRIYTDGSTRGNGKENAIGGWAYVVINENGEKVWENSGSEVETTNQRMELTAAIMALEHSLRVFHIGDVFVLYTDSAYLHNCYEQKWYDNWILNGWKNAKKQPVANKDLWLRLVPFFTSWGFEFKKVKGHAGDKWNEYVDTLAQKEADDRKAEVLKCWEQ